MISYMRTLPWGQPVLLVKTVASNAHVRNFVKAYAVLYFGPWVLISVRGGGGVGSGGTSETLACRAAWHRQG